MRLASPIDNCITVPEMIFKLRKGFRTVPLRIERVYLCSQAISLFVCSVLSPFHHDQTAVVIELKLIHIRTVGFFDE